MGKFTPDRTIRAKIELLSQCSLFREDGSQIWMKTLWEKQPAILIFLRHFACDACRLHAVDVWQKREQFLATGASLHFIGNGAPHFITSFKKQYGLDGASFFTDPSRQSFFAAGFKRGFWINPGVMHSRFEFLKLASEFSYQKRTEGDVWQLGGVLAVRPGGVISYQFTSQAMADIPEASEIPKIIR